MSTMGMVYNNSIAAGATSNDQLMLLRTLQDTDRNIINVSNNNNNNSNINNNRSPTIMAKNNVSVISVNNQQQQQNAENNSKRMTTQTTSQNNATAVLPPYDPSRLKKHGKNGQPPPIAVAKRNARERNRVKQVNNGFATLRQHIPSHVAQGYGDRGKKLSKVETLRMAVEYIRGLQRLLAEADGLDYDAIQASTRIINDASMMIPSPTGSQYSNSTHNGSGDVLGLGGSELDDQHEHRLGESATMEDDGEQEYMMEDEDEDDRRVVKRFRDDGRIQNRLSENQNRNPQSRRSRTSPTDYYITKQSSFGDEENIEPTLTRNNNTTPTNNNVLTSFSLLPSPSTALPSIKRELPLLEDDDRSPHDANLILTSSSPYSGEIFIESPETGRLVPLKMENPHDTTTSAQLVYVAAADQGYYRSEIVAGDGTEFMDLGSWWDTTEAANQRFGLQQQQHQIISGGAHV